uniref:Uncharacterized protein n=1 Tax=Arundo donax TaxID=35708 RepID=A0A0A9BJE4_ARUDO
MHCSCRNFLLIFFLAKSNFLIRPHFEVLLV